MAKVKAGEGNCPACGERIVWRLSDSGALSCFCQDCDFQGYAKDGTEAKRLISARFVGAAPAAEQKPAPAPKPAAKPEPEKKGAFGVFGL